MAIEAQGFISPCSYANSEIIQFKRNMAKLEDGRNGILEYLELYDLLTYIYLESLDGCNRPSHSLSTLIYQSVPRS